MTEDWQPGIPLHPRGSYTNYVFNFRPEPESETCLCPDAAGWPTPRAESQMLLDGDEIGDLIRWYRAHPEALVAEADGTPDPRRATA